MNWLKHVSRSKRPKSIYKRPVYKGQQRRDDARLDAMIAKDEKPIEIKWEGEDFGYSWRAKT